MEMKSKFFPELTTRELYEILKARAEIFVVEQNCVYQDLDDMSDEDLTKEIAMNPYLQYFLGLREYRYECPFDASMMTRFRQRISKEMLA